MSTLRHPHIVQFLGICYPPGAQLPALVMELLMTSLHIMLESTPDIPMSIKHSILRGVARGLVFLHSLDPAVIHRDLTANNVLIDSSLTAKITDLGMARLLKIQAGRSVATMTKGPGNAAYMPPEAKDGDVTKYGKPIDTFSMGNLILFTATQECPDPVNPTFFDPITRSTKARTEIERRVTSFQLFWQMFGKEHPLVLLANQCLQDDPEIRPTAPEILQRLDKMPMIPYRDWDLSKMSLVQDVLQKEHKIATLEKCLVEQEKKVVDLQNQYAQSSPKNGSQLDHSSDHEHNRSQLERVKLGDGAMKDEQPSQYSAITGKCVDNSYSYLLMKDTQGKKAANRLMVAFGSGSKQVRVLRGELLTIIRELQTRNDGKPAHNFLLRKDPNVTLYCGEEDVAPLSRDDLELLEAIQKPCDQFAVFAEDDKLEWGGKLKMGDPVYVKIPSYHTSMPDWSIAVVQYVGKIKSLPGRYFGVEIKDPRYRGRGSTDGFFQSYQYFQCEKNCGLFVSLDKLSSKPNPQSPQGAAQQQLLSKPKSSSTLPPRGTNTPHQPTVRPGSNSSQGITSSMDAQFNLRVGSTVQLATYDQSTPKRYGVIRWVGTVPQVEGPIAGIELEEYTEGCSDGTFPATGEKIFECPPGHGFYFPLANVRPDERFDGVPASTGVSLHDNPLQVPMEEEEDQFIEDASQQMLKYIGDEKGIQGHQNSCYIDSTLFGLFAFSDVFDAMFLEADKTDKNRKAICSLLWKGIANPLRKNGVVRYESVMKLRNKLDELGKMEGITEKEKDPEEFLNMLFKHVLHTTPFISIKRPFGVEQEFFVQLFVEYDANLRLPTVGDLLMKMFTEQYISFTKVPSRLLIQVPRFGREFKTYQKIVPDLKLRITELTDTFTNALIPGCFICEERSLLKCSECNPESELYYCTQCSEMFHGHPSYPDRARHRVQDIAVDVGFVSELALLSVICIETSHYVCFTRDPRDMDEEKRWIFHDSMADRLYDRYNIPKVTDCTVELNEWVYPPNGDRTRLMSTQPRQLPELVRRFTQDVYMCVYIQPDVAMYGDEGDEV